MLNIGGLIPSNKEAAKIKTLSFYKIVQTLGLIKHFFLSELEVLSCLVLTLSRRKRNATGDHKRSPMFLN